MLPASQVDLVDCCDIDICQQYSCHCYCYDNDSGLLNTSPVSGQVVQDSCAISTEQSNFNNQNRKSHISLYPKMRENCKNSRTLNCEGSKGYLIPKCQAQKNCSRTLITTTLWIMKPNNITGTKYILIDI